jgi:hypothetical protein
MLCSISECHIEDKIFNFSTTKKVSTSRKKIERSFVSGSKTVILMDTRKIGLGRRPVYSLAQLDILPTKGRPADILDSPQIFNPIWPNPLAGEGQLII